jgi:arsenate reductase-like glutaredoxin family protein
MSVKHVGKCTCIGKTVTMLEGFDIINAVPMEADYHTQQSSKEDMQKLLTQLAMTCKVFANESGR